MANSANPEINKKIATSALGTLVIATVFFYLGDRYAETLVTYPGQIFDHLGDAMLTMWETIGDAPFALDMTSNSLLFGGACFLIIWMIWLRYVAFIGNYRSGEESGSARWGTVKEGKKFKDLQTEDNNLLFTKNFGLALHRPKFDPEYDRNLNVLCRKALSDYGGKLPTPVHFIFDEFANIGTIPQIEETIAVTRSRNIGITIILQSMSQLESKYDKKAQTIIDCCDSTLFLGGKSNSTNKEIAEMIGKQTIHQMTYNESTGQSSSASKNLQIQGRDLIDAAEIGKMSRLKAILLIAGTNPLMDDKYDPHAHKRYRYIVDKRNWKRLHKNSFDFERYLKNGCEPYTPDEDMGAEFTAWKWAAWKKSRKGLLGKLLNR